jgi:hypothetical protein
MKSERFILLVTLLVFGCTVVGILAYVPARQLSQSFGDIVTSFQVTAKILLILLGLSIGLVIIIGLIWLAAIAYASALVWYSLARTRQAEALKLEREASLILTIAPPGSQVYASEIIGKLNVTHKPLYLMPGSLNREDNDPTLEQIKRWSFFQLTHNISKKPELATEEIPQLQPPLPEHVDLGHYITGSTSLRHIFLGIGRLPNGTVQPISAPLSRLVHIAVAGASGFGKSTFMQTLGYQVLNAREKPNTVMLDTQGVTFTSFDGHDGLHYPLASDREDIKAILFELVSEMDRRKKLFGRWRGIDSLENYNRVISVDQRLPVMPIFFDEFGLLAGDKDIAGYVKRLSQVGRKFGLYLIAGSQTWYSDEIASSLKANLSTSVQFYAKSKSQSRVLLEDSAAYNLLRPGQAYCRLPGQAGLIELQAPDAQSIVNTIPTPIDPKNQGNPTMPTMPSPEPTPQEQLILDLFDEQAQQGEVNKAKISLEVFGGKGGNQYKRIGEVLQKFGRL